MQVIEANNGLLTNFEVLNLLRERKQARSLFSSVTTQDQGASLVNTSSMVSERQRIDSQHRLAIENKVRFLPPIKPIIFIYLIIFCQTFQYFQRKMLSDCSLEEISNYLLQMKQHAFNFTESEYIQLANLLPESDVEFYLVWLRLHS